MSEDSKSARTQIIVAIIGLVGVFGTALITQWEKIFPSHSQDNAGIVQKPATPPQQTKEIDNGPSVADAERLTANYFAALKKGDVDSVVGMTSVPFFCEKMLLLSRDDVRTTYASYLTDFKRFENMPAIESVKSQTIEDFKKSAEGRGGKLPDSVLSSLRMEDGDFAVVVAIRKEYLLLLFRHDGPSLSMAGWLGWK